MLFKALVLLSTTTFVGASSDEKLIPSLSGSEVIRHIRDSFVRPFESNQVIHSQATTPLQGYVNFNVYCGGGGCTNYLVLGSSTQLQTCYKNTKGTYTFNNASTNAVAGTITQFSWTFADAACKTAVGKPTVTTASSTCTVLSSFAGCYTIFTSTPAIPTNPGYQAVVTK